MEEFNYRNFIHNDSERRRLILLLYAVSCFLPDSNKIQVNIIIRLLEIMDLIQQQNNMTYCGLNESPSLEEGIEKLKEEPHLQQSPEITRMISMFEMVMKFMQMKDLMEALGEMNPQASSNTFHATSPIESLKDMDPALLEAILPPEYSDMIHILTEMMNQNSADHHCDPCNNNCNNNSNNDS